DLRSGVQRQRPQLPAELVGGDRGSGGLLCPALHLLGVIELVQGAQAVGGDRVTQVRVVQHEQVVAAGELVDRGGLEALQRLGLPVQPLAVAEPVGSRLQRVPAARVVPGQAQVLGHGRTGTAVAATVPLSSRLRAFSSSMPSSARISRVCSPPRGAPRSTDGGVLVNRYGKPGVFTRPSVGWSYSTKVPLCTICGSCTRSA